MKKITALLLAIVTAISLCLPTFAEDVDYSQMDVDEYREYSEEEYYGKIKYYTEKPTKSILAYKLARLSDKEIEKQAEIISGNALPYIFPATTLGVNFEIVVNLEQNHYIFNKKVFNKAVDKIYAKQERFFAAYGDEFDSERQFMTKEHIAGELYIHTCLYELTYRLTFISSLYEIYENTRLTNITPLNLDVSDNLIDSVGAIVLR